MLKKALVLAALAQGCAAMQFSCPGHSSNKDHNQCEKVGDDIITRNGVPYCASKMCTLCGLGSSGDWCDEMPKLKGEVSNTEANAHGSTNTRVTFFTDGAKAWPDITTSIFSYVPDFAYDYDVTVPESKFPANKRITFSCPTPNPRRGQQWDGCTAFVYQYRCPGCSFNNGGLPKFMMDNGWDAAHCAPRFRLVPGGVEHSMVTFMKSMANGEDVHFDTSDTTEFLAWHGSRMPVHCAARMTVGSCHNTPNHPGICVWDHNRGTCRTNNCPRNIGPSLGNTAQCRTCTSDEIDANGNDITAVMVQNNDGGRRR